MGTEPVNQALDLNSMLSLPVNRGLGVDIAERLRGAILNGLFGPGERLPEESLAKTMGVSRGPVREALVQLEREGLIVIRRNRGAFVAQLAMEDLDEVYTLRVAIEKLAVQRCIENASEAELDDLQRVVDRIAELMETGITEQDAAELDLEFHDIIYRTGRHRRLYETWGTLRPQIHVLLLNRNVASEDFRQMVVPSHQQILDALRARDEQLAIEITMDHLLGSYSRVRANHIQRYGDSSATRQKRSGVNE
jgi:DNA-binding GntR family transcriptional regulator